MKSGTVANGTKLRPLREHGAPSLKGMSILAQGTALGMCPILDWQGTLKGFSKKRRLQVTPQEPMQRPPQAKVPSLMQTPDWC